MITSSIDVRDHQRCCDLYREYRDLRLNRIAMEQQFAIVDGLEMLSSSCRDRWWHTLTKLREREQSLAQAIDTMHYITRTTGK